MIKIIFECTIKNFGYKNFIKYYSFIFLILKNIRYNSQLLVGKIESLNGGNIEKKMEMKKR